MKKEVNALQKVYDQLKKDGEVSSQADFAEKTGFATTPMSQMLNGTKPWPYRLLEVLYTKFKVDTNFIISNGNGQIYRAVHDDGELTGIVDEEKAPYSTKSELLEKEIKMLREQLNDKEKIISLLEGKNRDLSLGRAEAG